MRKRLAAIATLLLVAFLITRAQSNFVGQRLAMVDGLPTNVVNSIVQDRNGYMWIATTCGLSRYDGYSFHNYNMLSSNPRQQSYLNVQLLFNNDRDGLIWVYNSQHTMKCYDTETAQFVDYTERGDDARPYYHRIQTSEALWLFDGMNGVRRVTKENGRFRTIDYTTENGLLPKGGIRCLSEDAEHGVWICTEHGILHVASDGSQQIIEVKETIISGNTDGQQYFVLDSNGDVAYYNKEGRCIRKVKTGYGTISLVRESFVWRGQWILLSTDATYAIDISTGHISRPTQYQMRDGVVCGVIDNEYYVSDHCGTLYIFAHDGLVSLPLIPSESIDANRYRHFSVTRDQKGRTFVATYGYGLYVLDSHHKITAHYSRHDAKPLITSDLLTCINTDRSGCVWIGSRSGVFKLSEQQQLQASYLLPVPQSRLQLENSLRCVAKDGDKLIVTTSDGDMYIFRDEQLQPVGKERLGVKCIMRDKNGRLWMGTRGNGLLIDGVAYTTADASHHIQSNVILDICQDQRGRVWIASWEGLLVTQPEGSQPLHFTHMLHDDYGQQHVSMLQMDKQQRLWMATENGLYMLDTRLANPTAADIRHFNRQDGSLPCDEVSCLAVSSNDTLWVGSNIGLMRCQYDEESGHLSYFLLSTREGLVCNNIHAIVEDGNGKIWVGTEEGLSCLDYQRKAIRNFILSDIHERNTFSSSHPIRLDDGRIAMATDGGLLVFTPFQERNESEESKVQNVLITDLYINGRSVYDLEGDLTQGKSLNNTKSIRLSHEQKNVTFYFSDFGYSNRETRLYRYRLEGVDTEWQQVTSRNQASYSNLNPGSYLFLVQARDSEGEWTESTQLRIRVMQPWWNTWWAWTIYLLTIGLTALFFFRARHRHFVLQQQLMVNKQVSDFKMEFFTNIAHELRTPLALIQTSAEAVVKNPQSRSTMQTLRRGSARLQRLIEQLMEFRKVSTGSMRIRVAQGDIIKALRDVYQDFWALVKRKDITMTMTPHVQTMQMPFDSRRIEMIIYNLLSNAVKYTPEQGNITIRTRLTEDSSMLEIAVENSGNGLTEKQEKALFQPFMNGLVSQGGIGIGLYMARLIAEKHHGSLSYRRSDSSGCIFTVALPTSDSEYSTEEHQQETAIAETPLRTQDTEFIREMAPQTMNDKRLILIEDDLDMQEQLRQTLIPYLQVECYSDGERALEAIISGHPDMVVSDIILPGKSGLEIVRAMRKNETTREIPVILLTALDDDTSKLRAIRYGADDYLVKPCNPKLLVARCLQLIEKSLNTSHQESEPTAPQHLISNDQDRRFVERIQGIVDANIGNPNFGVDQLAEQLGAGRTKSFYKIKQLTGETPNAYILNRRLEYALSLLYEGELTVSEISYAAGFNSASYFTTCFKQKYGVPPTKFKGKEPQD